MQALPSSFKANKIVLHSQLLIFNSHIFLRNVLDMINLN